MHLLDFNPGIYAEFTNTHDNCTVFSVNTCINILQIHTGKKDQTENNSRRPTIGL